jgi:NADP-dependent 3-hydroxy acid dehydrogenase YdfG
MNRATDRGFPDWLGMSDRSLEGCRVLVTGGSGGVGRETAARMIEPGAIATHLQPYSDERLAEFEKALEMLPAAEVAEAILFAATRPPGVDVVTLRIEPPVQKIC